MQLIMVEGVPFSGKSTLSEFIALQLGLNGAPAQWVPEGLMLRQYFPHVLAVLERRQSVSEEAVLADWQAFVQEVRAGSMPFVVDAPLSYAAVFPLLTADRPRAQIIAEVRGVANVCAPLHPRVIHLTGDVDRITRASIVERGEGWEAHMVGQSDAAPYQQARGRSGVEGAIRFLHEAQAFMHEVLEGGGWQTLTLDVSAGNWATNRRAVLDFLGIAEVAVERPLLSHAVLQTYTGSFRADDPEGDTFAVRLEQDSLALHGPTMRFGTLVPVSATRFHVTATRLDAEFVVEEGVAQRLVLFTHDGAAHVFHRHDGTKI